VNWILTKEQTCLSWIYEKDLLDDDDFLNAPPTTVSDMNVFVLVETTFQIKSSEYMKFFLN